MALKIYENVIISRDIEGQIIYQKEHNLDSVNWYINKVKEE